MNKLTLIFSGVLIAVLAGLAFFQHRSQEILFQENQTLQTQVDQLTQLNTDLSNAVTQAASSPSLSDAQQTELLRLRNEVTMLRSRTNRIDPGPLDDPQIRELQIVSARYGNGTNVADVTARVIELLHRESSGFTARADWLNIDPAPYKNKTLTILYNYAGQTKVFAAAGGDRVNYTLLEANAKK